MKRKIGVYHLQGKVYSGFQTPLLPPLTHLVWLRSRLDASLQGWLSRGAPGLAHTSPQELAVPISSQPYILGHDLASNRPWWEHLHHGNQQTLQIRSCTSTKSQSFNTYQHPNQWCLVSSSWHLGGGASSKVRSMDRQL